MGHFDVERNQLQPYNDIPKSVAPANKIRDVANALKNAKAPLVVIGKGAAFARAEQHINALVER